jgi:hypothetical protein
VTLSGEGIDYFQRKLFRRCRDKSGAILERLKWTQILTVEMTDVTTGLGDE